MKKAINLQRTIKSLLMLGLAMVMLISCKFTANHKNNSEEDTVLVNFTTILPDDYKTDAERSAIPEFSDDTLLYDVTASFTENGTAKTITRTGCSKNFSLPLIPEKNYTVTVKAYDSSETEATKKYLFTGTKTNITVSSLITGENGPFSIPLTLGTFAAGTGSLSLPIKVTYEAHGQSYTCSYILSGNGITAISDGIGGADLPANTTTNIQISNIAANSNPYDLFLTFKYGSTIVYQFHTDVMIFAGAETNTWKNEIELGTGTDSNTLIITQALVDAYTAKYFYVKNTTTSGATVNDDGQGTYDSPWFDLSNAIEKILSINNGNTKYTIYVLSDLAGTYTLHDTVANTDTAHNPGKIVCEIPSSNTKDLSILIQGIGETRTLNSGSTAPEISITNSSSKNVSFEFVNLSFTNKIETTNADIKLKDITSPEINFTNTNATLIGVTSNANLSGNNITLDADSTIRIGGKTGSTNNIRKLYLPKDGDNNQIKLQILNEDSDSTPLTLNGSTIGVALESLPDATSQYVIFTEGYADASNTSDLPNTVFNIFNNPDGYNVGAVAASPSESDKYEACIAISGGSISIGYMDNVAFSASTTTIESKALNASDGSSSITIPSGYTANPRTITVSAVKTGDDDFTISDFGTLSLKLISPQTNSVIASNENNAASITVPYGQTTGNYILRIFGLYTEGSNTVGYSSDIIISVVDNVHFMYSKTVLVKDGTDAEKTLTVSGTYNSNALTIGCLDSVNALFTITGGTSASIVLSAVSPACGYHAVNLYGKYDGTYFRDTLNIDIVQFVFNFTETTAVKNISVKVKVSNNSGDDIILTPTSDFNINIKKVTGSGSSETETEIYIYDDLSTDSNTGSLIYTVPEDISVGLHRIYITAEYNGITKTEIVNTNLSGLTQTPSGTFNSSTTLSDSGVFIANRNITIPQLIASDHEVTQGEYEQFMTYYGRAVSGSGTGASGNSTPYAPSNNYGLGSDYPAYYVCWYEAIMYCNFKSIADNLTPAYYLADSSGEEVGGAGNGRNPSSWLNTNVSGTNISQDANGKYYYNNINVTEKLDYQGSTDADGGIRYDQNADGWRLPTEAEWEYFARGGNLSSTGQQTYIGTDSADVLTDYAWYGANSGTDGGSYSNGGKSHEVKTKLPNALNLYDMCGNVWEWCWDWEGSINADTDITGASSGNSKSTRGGGWSQPEPVYFTISHRHKSPPRDRYENLGFRVVRTVFE